MRNARITLAALLTVALVGFVAAPAALATPGLPWVLAGSFNGSATPNGSFQTTSIGVNRATGHVLVVDEAHSAVLQFDESGNPVNFTSTSSPKLPVTPGEIAVDNSGGPTQGNFYILHQGQSVEGFAPSGAKLGGPWPIAGNPEEGQLYSMTVDADGNVWLGYYGGSYNAVELSQAGTPTGAKIQLVGALYGTFCDFCQRFAFDSHRNVDYTVEDGSMLRLDASDNYEVAKRHPIKGEKVPPRDVAVDPSTDDSYWNHGTNIGVTKYTEPYAEEPPSEILPGLTSASMEFSADGQTLFATEEGSKINIFKRQPPKAPEAVGLPDFSNVKSESSFVSGVVDTGGGGAATYYFEYGLDTSYGHRSIDFVLPHTTFGLQHFSGLLTGLEPDKTYHVRYVVTNATGTDASEDALIRTLPPVLTDAPDSCTNALARKQTSAPSLPDCRAYELVSAGYTGGYDVESPMVPGQKPFGGYPDVDGRVLYGVHAGVVPGPWNPTNRGVDPYVAVRGSNGWTTEYVGLPADLSPDKAAFSSALGGADGNLRTFAFAGEGLCDPCFSDSPETGIPLRNAGGLSQAMAGPNVPSSNEKPEGRVQKMLSADGTHLVFGSKYGFTANANSNATDLNIFDRDLTSKTTQLVSTTPGGSAIQAGMGVSELAISDDGSRILIATDVSEDSAGNEYVHPYMHIGTSPGTVDLAPGATSGVLFDGMTADGSRVFFTSSQALSGSDTDGAADIYESEIGTGGSVSVKLVTDDGASGSCNPVANDSGSHWNSVGAAADCGAVAIGGAAGIARQSGTVYFLSPEALDGAAVANQPNLYVVPGDGSAARFVGTLSPNDPVVIGSVHAAASAEGQEFETTPDGRFATFRSADQLTGIDNDGEISVFLFDALPSGGAPALVCPSCNATLTEDPTMKAAATLAGNGLSLTDDGRVFFNTPAPLATQDTGGRRDVYEWVGGRTYLISSGIGRFDSELLTTTRTGTDAYFFSHDTFDPSVDENGERTKIYDARTDGGFFTLPVKPQCAASDECHGPGTEAAGPPQIASSGKTSEGNVKATSCAKGKVRRNGKCVNKHKPKKQKPKKKGKRHHG